MSTDCRSHETTDSERSNAAVEVSQINTEMKTANVLTVTMVKQWKDKLWKLCIKLLRESLEQNHELRIEICFCQIGYLRPEHAYPTQKKNSPHEAFKGGIQTLSSFQALTAQSMADSLTETEYHCLIQTSATIQVKANTNMHHGYRNIQLLNMQYWRTANTLPQHFM